MILIPLSCWNNRKKIVLLIVANVLAVFFIYEYRHFGQRGEHLRKPSIEVVGSSKVWSSPADARFSKNGRRTRVNLYKNSPRFNPQRFASFSGIVSDGQGPVRPQTTTTSNTTEITSAETVRLVNETMATLLNERRRPRHNMDMNLFLKNSGWLERQLVNASVYVYKNLLDSPTICLDQGANLSLLVTVLTSVQNMAQRMAIRDTWGKEVKRRGGRVLFFLGLSFSPAVQSLAQREWADYGDLIQEDFVDSYYNLSTKTISVLKWVSTKCPKVKFVLKTDDDIYVNAPSLFQTLDTLNDSAAIYGMLAHRWRPIRYKKNKWYVPFRHYPWAHYPDFVAGPAYIIAGSATPSLYNIANHMKPFFLEDVFVTGFVAILARVPRFDQKGIKNSRDTFNPCSFNQTISSHSHPSWDMRRRFRAIASKTFICRSKPGQDRRGS